MGRPRARCARLCCGDATLNPETDARSTLRRLSCALALASFGCYLLLFPGSLLTLVLRQVPDWGAGMGGALLVLQGMAACAWLVWRSGRRGLAAAAALALLAWAAEHVGETTGWPFGRYHYTDLLGPQIAGRVPVPIVCAWIMAALGAWQLAGGPGGAGWRASLLRTLKAATLVLALDLQIETVATRVNGYWVWRDSGPYYGVPTANFVAWWLVGLLAAALLRAARAAPLEPRSAPGARRGDLGRWAALRIPALLYALSTLMFTAVNLAYGYALAGGVGVATLALLGWRAAGGGRAPAIGSALAARRSGD